MEIVEVGPRDGLQNEAVPVSVQGRVALINALSGVGFARIEAASFVSPKWVPQMAGAEAVMAGISRNPGVRYAALVPNAQGMRAALAARVDEVAVFASASEGFSRANINASIAESLERFQPVLDLAGVAGVPVRGYVSCVVECPFDGVVAPAAVARVVSNLLALGCFEVSLGDTLGRARSEDVDAMLQSVLGVASPGVLAGHFHDTGGRALENIGVALGRGLRVFDASVAGLGGCPYAPGAPGNVASEAVAGFLAASGFEHGLDMTQLATAAEMARSLRGGMA